MQLYKYEKDTEHRKRKKHPNYRKGIYVYVYINEISIYKLYNFFSPFSDLIYKKKEKKISRDEGAGIPMMESG